jgi:hypothetical protein
MMRRKGVIVLLVQMALVLSIAAKYAWERHSCPMVWTRATQFDPARPLRGRYLALTLGADACGLPASHVGGAFGWNPTHQWSRDAAFQWNVVPAVRNGKLAPQPVSEGTVGSTLMSQAKDVPCEYASLNEQTEFFVAEHAQTPFPLQQGQELWALVTVPTSGPPRPVRLAVSDAKGFRVLDLQ